MDHGSRDERRDERDADKLVASERPVKKPYKSPTISRHGNLRLMTQLE
jgi:hypothetical protein